MKTKLTLAAGLALAALLFSPLAGQEKTTDAFRLTAGTSDASFALTAPSTRLSIGCGSGYITIDYKTGNVTLPPGVGMAAAARQFWEAVAKAFPEARAAMLAPGTTVTWGDDYLKAHPERFPAETRHFEFVRLGLGRDQHAYEFGLRSDGVVVWREINRP